MGETVGVSDMQRVGLAAPARSHADVIAAYAAASDVADRLDEARNRSERADRDRDLAERLAAADADAELAASERRGNRLGKALTAANQAAGAGAYRADNGYRGSFYR